MPPMTIGRLALRALRSDGSRSIGRCFSMSRQQRLDAPERRAHLAGPRRRRREAREVAVLQLLDREPRRSRGRSARAIRCSRSSPSVKRLDLVAEPILEMLVEHARALAEERRRTLRLDVVLGHAQAPPRRAPRPPPLRPRRLAAEPPAQRIADEHEQPQPRRHRQHDDGDAPAEQPIADARAHRGAIADGPDLLPEHVLGRRRRRRASRPWSGHPRPSSSTGCDFATRVLRRRRIEVGQRHRRHARAPRPSAATTDTCRPSARGSRRRAR